MNPRIFISYSRQNMRFVDRFAIDLERAGCVPWVDREGIPPGDEWRSTITRAIEEHDVCLLLLSPEANESEEVRKEIDIARSLSKRIIPAIVAGRESDLDPDYARMQLLDFRITTDYWESMAKLLKSLMTSSASLPTPMDLFGRTIAEAYAELRGNGRRWRVNSTDFLSIPIRPSGYTMSWVVAPAPSTWQKPNHVHVVLRFSGDASRETLGEVLEYVAGNGWNPWVLYVQGPERLDGEKRSYVLPDSSPHIWNDAIRACVSAINLLAKGKTLHLFCDAPATLTFAVGSQLREMMPYKLYQLNRNGSGAERYSLIFEGNPS